MTRVRLRLIATADFRKSEVTNYQELVPKAVREDMKPSDAVCLVSRLGNQVVFVYAEGEASGVTVFRSQRLRLEGAHRWEGRMLKNYAADVGLELIGLKGFEDHIKRKK